MAVKQKLSCSASATTASSQAERIAASLSALDIYVTVCILKGHLAGHLWQALWLSGRLCGNRVASVAASVELSVAGINCAIDCIITGSVGTCGASRHQGPPPLLPFRASVAAALSPLRKAENTSSGLRLTAHFTFGVFSSLFSLFLGDRVSATTRANAIRLILIIRSSLLLAYLPFDCSLSPCIPSPVITTPWLPRPQDQRLRPCRGQHRSATFSSILPTANTRVSLMSRFGRLCWRPGRREPPMQDCRRSTSRRRATPVVVSLDISAEKVIPQC